MIKKGKRKNRCVKRKEKVKLKEKSKKAESVDNVCDKLCEDNISKNIENDITKKEIESEVLPGALSTTGRRKPCGKCIQCNVKVNCGECIQCINRKTGKQICKLRKCVEIAKEQKSSFKQKKKVGSKYHISLFIYQDWQDSGKPGILSRSPVNPVYTVPNI